MKKLALIIAAAAAIGTVSPALADSVRVRVGDGWHHRHHERVVIREHRHHGWYRGHHYGWRNHHRGASVVIR
jgi:hypothetical protein